MLANDFHVFGIASGIVLAYQGNGAGVSHIKHQQSRRVIGHISNAVDDVQSPGFSGGVVSADHFRVVYVTDINDVKTASVVGQINQVAH